MNEVLANWEGANSPVPALVRRAVIARAEGRDRDARAALAAIDQAGLLAARKRAYEWAWGPEGVAHAAGAPSPHAVKRVAVSHAFSTTVWLRDHYTCRYAHCRRTTIDVEVLQLLSRAYPEVLPYDPHWQSVERLVVYWTFAASIEHLVPVARGGDSSVENLLTTCYQCNDLKNHLDIATLGWSVAPPTVGDWRGLTEYLPVLRRIDKAAGSR